MTSQDVVLIYRDAIAVGIELWIDGGWGVDALLGEQTRPHKDLDIVIQHKDVPALWQFLETRGYRKTKQEIARPWNFVLGDASVKEIDVHVIVMDGQGNGIYGPPEKGEMYPAASLTGMGTIEGHTVRCISAEWAVKFHAGYELQDKDFQDVSALCRRFGIALPKIYERFQKHR